MKPAERAALIDRIARALAWETLSDPGKATRRSEAAAIVDELRTGYEQNQRIGWVFVDTEGEPETVE